MPSEISPHTINSCFHNFGHILNVPSHEIAVAFASNLSEAFVANNIIFDFSIDVSEFLTVDSPESRFNQGLFASKSDWKFEKKYRTRLFYSI